VTTRRQPSTGVGPDDSTQAVDAVDGAEPLDADPIDATDVASEPDVGAETDPRGMDAVNDLQLTPPPIDPDEAGQVAEAAVGSGDGQDVDGSVDLTGAQPDDQRPISRAVRRTGKVRKARLRLLRVEPWSVMKSAFVLSIAIGITFVVATATLWSVVDAAGVFEVVGDLVTELTESETETGFELTDYIGFSRVMGLATVIAVIDVVLLTALATLFAFLYNLSAALLGGFEITLAEDD
jgi:hypothetical protein